MLCLCSILLQAQEYPTSVISAFEVIPGFFKPPVDGNFIQPTGVAVNSAGHIFVFNKGNKQLMEFDATGQYLRSLGHGLFKSPHGLRIDRNDNIWTTDTETHLVIKMNSNGQVLMVLGEQGKSGLFDEVRNRILFFKPADIAIANNGDIYVADGYGNHRIVRLDSNGKLIKAWGKQGAAPGEFNNPHNIVLDQGANVYIADRNNKRIQVFDQEGNFKAEWTNLGKPWGLAISPEQYLYMTDGDAEKILKLDQSGTILAEFEGGPGTQNGQLAAAHGIAVGPQEELYITEVINWRVTKLEQTWRRGNWRRLLTKGNANYRSESAFIEVNDKFILLGGRNTRTVDIFDPATNTWTSGTKAPLEMHHFQAINYKNEIWIVGAFTGPYPKEEPVPFLHVYNPATDSWRVGGKLPEGRYRGAAGAVLYKDKFYLLCGNKEGHFTGHNTWFDVFDPETRTWTQLPDAPNTRDHFQMQVINDKLYAAGGRNTSAKTNHVMDQVIPEVDVFDFKTKTWRTLPTEANLPTLRAGTTSLSLDGRLVVIGGESGAQVPAHYEVEAYDINQGKWISLDPLLIGRHGMQAILYKGKIYLAGGSRNRGGGPELKSIDYWSPEE